MPGKDYRQPDGLVPPPCPAIRDEVPGVGGRLWFIWVSCCFFFLVFRGLFQKNMSFLMFLMFPRVSSALSCDEAG